jgi:hypothetical protein
MIPFSPSLLQLSPLNPASHEDGKGEAPIKTQDGIRNSTSQFLRCKVKGLQTSYNPIQIKGVVHANLLPDDFNFNAHDESYPKDASKRCYDEDTL